MLFFSPKFLLFFIIVFVLYWTISRIRDRKIVLLVASYLFYAAWDYRFLGLIIFSTVLDYIIGLRLGEDREDKQRKLLVLASLVGNLGVLCFFKYFNFFTESFAQFLSLLSVDVDPLYLNIILPVGISFYTFQTLSYTVDVYRKKIQTEKSFLNLSVFVAFFPQLTAGPIVRASVFLPQLTLTQRLQDIPWKGAVALFTIGLFKKLVVADNCAPWVEAVYNNPELYDVYSIIAATLIFTVQIYCDFSGYSDMAIGLAALFGFRFPLNFAWPYFSQNMALFWNRWHMSLNHWFRDYVFYSLIRTRRSVTMASVSLMVTFLLSGLWHGAAWTFVAFGFIQGVALIVFRYFKMYKKHLGITRNGSHPIIIGLSIAVTYIWYSFSTIFFRAQDMDTAIEIAIAVVTLSSQGTESLPSFIPYIWLILAVLHWFSWKFDLIKLSENMKPSVYGLVLGAYVAIIIAAMPSHTTPFAYFEF